MPVDLGDGNQLETDCGSDRCRFSAILFCTSGAHGECIWHANIQHKVSGGSLRWSFSGGVFEESGSKLGRCKLQQLCTPRPLPRWHDPEPLGGLSPAEFRKFSKAGVEVLGPYPVLLDEIGESRGCHRTGRSFRDRTDQLVQLLCCHPCACSHELPTK
jgi:hypothetical protein